MANENIKFAKPNMEFVDGYFFTMDETRKCLIQKSDDGSIVSSYPCQTDPTLLVYTDDFNTGNYNPNIWSGLTTNNGTTTFSNNTFRFAGNSGASVSYLLYKYKVKGAFDIRVNFKCLVYPATNDWGLYLYTRNSTQTRQFVMFLRGTSTNRSYKSSYYNGTTWTETTLVTTDLSGGLRINRASSASNSYGYYLNSSGSWTNTGLSHDNGMLANNNDIIIYLQMHNDTNYPAFTAEMDNFYASMSLSAIKSLQYDGTYFWTLQEIIGSNEPIIRKWLIRNYVCEMVYQFVLENSTSNTYDADAFAIEHYITDISTSASGGDTTIHMNEYYDTVVTSGSTLSIGDNGDSNLEDVIVSNVVGTDITISGGLLYDHSMGTKVITSPSFFLFNNYTGTSSTSGSLMRFNASTGSYMTSDSMSEYKNVTAATFNRFQNILRGYDDASAVVFVKNTEARFRNMSDLLSLTDASSANDNFIGDDGSIPDITKWSITDGDPRIYDNALFCSTVADGYDKVRSNYLLTGDFDVQISGSSGNITGENFSYLSDYFTYSGTGGVPDTSKWIRGGTNPSMGYLDNDTLYLATSGTGTSNVRTLYALRGNFDVQFDFTLVTYPSTNTWATNLVARISEGGDMIYISRRYESGHLFVMRTYGSVSTTVGSASSSLTTSKLRLVRSVDTITGYYWTGSAWASLGSHTLLGINDVYIYLWQDTMTSNPTSVTRYDNFVVNSLSNAMFPQYINGATTTVTGSLSDDFTYSGTGGVPDTTKWIRGGYTPLMYLDSNSLYASTSSGSNYIRTTYLLRNDFDVQVDFTLSIYPSVDNWASTFRATSVSGDIVQLSRRYASPDHKFVLDQYIADTGSWSATIGSVNSTMTTSKLRLKRVGSVTYGYYWTGSAWTSLGGGTSIGIDDVYIYIQQDRWTNNPTSEVRFDNFIVNSPYPSLYSPPIYSGPGVTIAGGLGDDFTYSGTGGVPDTNKWTKQGDLSQIYLDDNTLYACTTSSGGSSSSITSTFSLKGNFDYQVDIDTSGCPNTPHWASELRAIAGSSFIAIRREYDGTHKFNMRYYNGSTESVSGSITSTLTVSKLRITRSGSTIAVYYWTGTAWSSIGTNTNLGSSDITIRIVHMRATSTYPISVVRFDNFIINYVDEVSSFHSLHGMRLEFPNNSNHWCELTKRNGIDDGVGSCIQTRYDQGTTTNHLRATTTSTDYNLRLNRTGSTITYYYKTMTSGIMDANWTTLGTKSMYNSDCKLNLYLYSIKATISGSYFDDLMFNSGTMRYQSATIPYYGIMNIDNIRANGSTIIPVYDLSYSDGNLYRLQDEGTYYGVDNDWGTQYNYVCSPVRSFIDAIAIEAYPIILPADGRNIATINCVVLDQFSNGAIDKPITFTDNDAYGYVTINPKNTDNIFGTGQAITYYRAGVDVHAVTIQGTVTQYD